MMNEININQRGLSLNQYGKHVNINVHTKEDAKTKHFHTSDGTLSVGVKSDNIELTLFFDNIITARSLKEELETIIDKMKQQV